MPEARGLAVVTGASSGIGYELAKCCARDGFDLVVVSDEAEIRQAAHDFRSIGAKVDAVEADLSATEGVDRLMAAIGDRPVELLLANAGRGLGHAFVEQDFADVRRVIDTNITGTMDIAHRIVPAMKARDRGRVMFTGSIAGFMPGSYQAVYNATKAFVDSFSWALRNELKDSAVTVTCLMPGPTDTEFFERADMLDTQVGSDPKKDDPAMVARAGYDAMMKGKAGVVSGFSNKIQAAMAHLVPSEMLAQMHRKMAEPKDDAR